MVILRWLRKMRSDSDSTSNLQQRRCIAKRLKSGDNSEVEWSTRRVAMTVGSAIDSNQQQLSFFHYWLYNFRYYNLLFSLRLPFVASRPFALHQPKWLTPCPGSRLGTETPKLHPAGQTTTTIITPHPTFVFISPVPSLPLRT